MRAMLMGIAGGLRENSFQMILMLSVCFHFGLIRGRGGEQGRWSPR